jgi:hypothetical protein
LEPAWFFGRAEIDSLDPVVNGCSEVEGLFLGGSLGVNEHLDVEIKWAVKLVCFGGAGVNGEKIRAGFAWAAIQGGAGGAEPKIRDEQDAVEVSKF